MNPTERRTQYRLPFYYPIVVIHPKKTFTAYTTNLSKGGLFVATTLPLNEGEKVKIIFKLPEHTHTFCLDALIAHRIWEEQKCEIDCGIGLKFINIKPKIQSLINLHMLNERDYYKELRSLLKETSPPIEEINKIVKKLSHLKNMNIMELRYKVERVCIILDKFEKNKKFSPASPPASHMA